MSTTATLFSYTARSAQGDLVRGTLEAPNGESAAALLRSRDLYVTSLRDTDTPLGAILSLPHVAPVPHRSLAAFFRSFSTLVECGVPIRRCLEVTGTQCSSARLREALSSVGAAIETGLPLSDAMARCPREFPPLFVAMIRAGEFGGTLDQTLERVAQIVEMEASMRRRVASALAYPAFVSCAAVGIGAFLLTSVLPMFRTLYAQLHVPLPRITLALLALGSVAASPKNWIAIVVLAAIAVVAAWRLSRIPDVARFMDSCALRTPVAGTLLRKGATARFARLLAALLGSGVPLASSLRLIGGAMRNRIFQSSVDRLSAELSTGAALSKPLAGTGLYEPVFIQLVRAGEETGTLERMLARAADYYDAETEAALMALTSIVEPALILVLGGVVGTIVASVFIPLYTMIGSLK